MPKIRYPGVYVQEVPSGIRSIVGVATSIAAFVGRAAAGPTDEPVMLTGFADYEHRFGGLDIESPMSYAVRDFYLNGGRSALIVRVLHDDARAATINLDSGVRAPTGVVLVASSRGAWGNRLSVSVDHDTDRALSRGMRSASDPGRFSLTVRYRVNPGADKYIIENFKSVTTTPGDARFLPLVLEQESAYVRVHGAMPSTRPASSVTVIGGVRTVRWVDATIDSGSEGADITDNDVIGEQSANTGLYALNRADLFNLLCIPPRIRDSTSVPSRYTAPSARVYQAALALCVTRRAMLIVDPDPAWATQSTHAATNAIDGRNALGLAGPSARNAALYFPCVQQVDPLLNDRVDTFVPSGVVAGVMARTDAQRGVWKAPAGLDATLNGVQDLQINLSDRENGALNPLGINCLRSMGVKGRVIWGARTLRGANASADEYQYVSVRRLALYLEESLYRGTLGVVFEPNDEPLWTQVRLNAEAFMQGLFRQGAFQGATAREAYFVKCDRQTMSLGDIDSGNLNLVVGFAPMKPAEFVVITIQQRAGQIPP